MELKDFKIGDKVRRPDWPTNEYIELFLAYCLWQGNSMLTNYNILTKSADWQYWTPPEEKKNETWYRFEFKIKSRSPMCDARWYKSLEHYYESHRKEGHEIEYDIEPRVYEEREF